MSIDEQELRSRLEQTAARAGAPRFSAEDLTARVRRLRRRRRNRAAAVAVVMVAAMTPAVAIPLLSGGSGQAGMSEPAVMPAGPSFTVAVNGQTRVVPSRGLPSGPSEVYVDPGEKLAITVSVSVPAHPTVTALWLGITDGVAGSRSDGTPEMNPVLASSTRAPLRPGVHRFVLHWTVPAALGPGGSRQLTAGWAWSGGKSANGTAERDIADFAAPPGASFSAAALRRLRDIAAVAARGCNVPVPASVVAARTTIGKAAAALGEGVTATGYAASQAAYLVVMKGDFTGYHATAPPCAHAPAGHYLWVIVDAATFSTIATALRDKAPSVPLQTLGPVRNLTGRAG